MKFCACCWKGEGNIRLHYCDEQAGHEGPHKCHCGAILPQPVRLVALRSPSAYVAHSGVRPRKTK